MLFSIQNFLLSVLNQCPGSTGYHDPLFIKGKAYYQENLRKRIAKINLHHYLHSSPSMIFTKE
jgi:hypothetical protein